MNKATLLPKVWCETCEAVVDYHLEEPQSNRLTGGTAQDVFCAQCAYVIATFHELPKQ